MFTVLCYVLYTHCLVMVCKCQREIEAKKADAEIETRNLINGRRLVLSDKNYYPEMDESLRHIIELFTRLNDVKKYLIYIILLTHVVF